jgi:hypothetical protein
MIWYVATVAIVNLALGYALARILSAGHQPVAASAGESMEGPQA